MAFYWNYERISILVKYIYMLSIHVCSGLQSMSENLKFLSYLAFYTAKGKHYQIYV